MYTTKDAAIKLGMSYAAIYKYVKRYGIGTKVGFGRDLFLTDDDLAFIKTRKGQVGRPRGRELECDVVRSDGLTDDQYVRLNRGRK